MRKEIRLCGFGGQGIMLAGNIMGRAFALYEGLEAVMTQAYGPEARGGASSASIVVADRPIDFPFVEHADVLVILSQEAYTRFRPEAKAEATILIERDLVEPDPGDEVFAIPATQLAEELGRRIVANVVMLGFFTAVTGLIGRDSMEKAIQDSVRPETLELNQRAFHTGFSYVPQKERVS